MKKLYILLLAVILASAAGCKTEYKEPNGVTYGYYFYYVTKASVGNIATDNVLALETGSLENYNNPDYTSAYYFGLTVAFPDNGTSELAGQYEISSTGTSKLELANRGRDSSTGEAFNVHEIHYLISGTLNVEHVSDNKYKFSFSGITDQFTSLTAHYEGLLSSPGDSQD